MGEFYALVCTAIWSFAVILLQRATETAPPLLLNLFRSSLGLALLLLSIAVMGSPLFPDVPLHDYLILVLSGIAGIAIADTLFHKALHLAGAGVNAIVSTIYSPLVVLMAFWMIGERIQALDFLGMACIMSSLLLVGSLKPRENRTRAQMLAGIAIGMTEMLFLSFSIVLAKPVLNRSPILWATTIRQLGAVVALIVIVACSPQRRQALALYRPSPTWRFAIPGSVLGSYLSLIFWIAGMKYTQASIAAILNQTSTIVILILAVIFLGESFTPRRAMAAGLAFVGVLLITIL
ncbi:MAG: DMT family transporter [Candidatus Eisenbacteria bacterium]|nr:DMT family transporter [Candidatus Eisenbacteria bacterium]